MASVQHTCTGCVPIDASIIEVYIQLLGAETSANAAAERAEYAAEHAIGKSPYIGANGNWWEWDDERGEFIDTMVQAQGQIAIDTQLDPNSTNPVQNKVVTAAVNEKYTKPATGIPASDLASSVQTSLGKADTAYQKAGTGIPSSDMASAVQTSLGKADTAYQKPSSGIPASDLAAGVIPDISGKQDTIPDLFTIRSGAEAGLEAVFRAYDSQNPNGMGYLVLKSNKTFAEQVIIPNTIYEVRYDFDLGGASITMPTGCVLCFNGGSLSNGTLNGSDLYFDGYYADSLNVSLSGTNITPDFRIGASTDNEINRSKIQTATRGIVICGDITLAQNTSLNCDLRGIDKNMSITAATNMNYALLVTAPNVTISDITINKLIAAGAADEYTRGAIWGYANNLTIRGCIIYGAIEYLNQTLDTPLRGLYVRDNTIVADFTNITDNLYAQKDVFTFRGASDIFVTGNLITATKVLRVFKSTAKLSIPNDYTTQILNPNNIHIEDNVIKSVTTSAGGKQFFDLYVGTLSAYVRDNYIYTRGHTCLIENKTVTSVGTPAHIVVSGNIIDTDSQLSFISMTKNDVTEWRDNIISVTGYSQATEVFNLHGASFIFEHNKLTYSGSASPTFFALATETTGTLYPMPYAKINANTFTNTRRVDCQGVDFLEYHDNDVTTSDQQINVNYDDNLHIDLRQRIFNQLSTPIIVVQSAIGMSKLKMTLDLGRTTQMIGRALANTEAAKTAYVSAVTSDIPVYGYGSSNAIYQLKDTYAGLSNVSGYYLGTQTAKVFLTGADYGYQIYYDNSGWHAYDGGAICKRKGDTASRPTLTAADAGTVYYDTDLDHYVVFDGTSWVDDIGDINSILSTI